MVDNRLENRKKHTTLKKEQKKEHAEIKDKKQKVKDEEMYDVKRRRIIQTKKA